MPKLMCLVLLGDGIQLPPQAGRLSVLFTALSSAPDGAWHIVGAQQMQADGLPDGPSVSKALWGLNLCEL